MTKALDLIDGKPCLVEMPEPFSLAVTRHEWEEAQLREVQHTDSWHRRNDRDALEIQVQYLRCVGAL